MSRKPSRARLVNALLVALALGLLAWTIWSNRLTIQDVLDRRPDPWLFLLGFALYMTGLISTFIRWRLLVRALGLPFPVRTALRLGFIGNVFNLVIPGAVGGDLIKAAYLFREFPRKKTQAGGSIAIDRIIGLLGLFLLGALAGLAGWQSAGRDLRTLIALVWCAAVGGIVGLAVVFTPALYRPFVRWSSGRGRLETLLVELVAMASVFRGRVGTLVVALVFAMSNHTLNIIAFYLVGQAMFHGEAPTLGQHFLTVPLVLFTTAVPLPFGALGLTELVSQGLFTLVGQPDGAVGMMGFRLLMYGGGLISVAVYLLNLRQVRTLEAEAEEVQDELDTVAAPSTDRGESSVPA
ncbi:MAG: lysylphosphatidylglycerol synthase transmembrane domain-containing protein [Isosphaeraceae bacterium]